jgi:hypothetical protein
VVDVEDVWQTCHSSMINMMDDKQIKEVSNVGQWSVDVWHVFGV